MDRGVDQVKVLLAVAAVLVIVGAFLAGLAALISLVGEIVGDPLAQERQRPIVIAGGLVAALGGLLSIVPIARGTHLR